MKFSIFRSPKASQGELCTWERFTEVTSSEWLRNLCAQIAACEDKDERGELKKRLPVITWQAYFDGRRKASEAQPSGLFMLDIDDVENPFELWSKIAPRRTELGIVYAEKTASMHGLRLVAKCRKEYRTIAECQYWLAKEIGTDYDSVCKDWARCSFVVDMSHTLYCDAKLFSDEAEEGTIYEVGATASGAYKENVDMEQMLTESDNTEPADQRGGLFGGATEYRGLPLTEIAHEWLQYTGGEPQIGERNARLYKLALRMRYLTDFNEATMLRVMPAYGLKSDEMRQLIHSAITTTRAADMPRDMQETIDTMQKQRRITDESDEELPDVSTSTDTLPRFPPVISEFVETAPADFKAAVALCQLPILGTLGSRLRAQYLDGTMHSPSFQVSLEAPQASGKSFMRKLAETELAQIIEHDEQEREREREYDAKVKELKLLNVKVNKKDKEELLGSRPQTLVRYVPATMSITRLLQRAYAAQGLHLFAMSEEIDTVTKAFKRGFSSYSDLLRIAFDNAMYGQDYASENSFSGNVRIYYNFLTSGTPKAMRRFYPDVEDGLVSRVCFVVLPDQFGKPMPKWGELNAQQKAKVEIGLVRLNEITIQGNEVQPEHVMKLEFLNKEMQKWLLAQQAEAVRQDDRTRDVFCRRAAVVGFRAGMLAYFLWGEVNTPTIRRHTTAFAQWVANSMLNQHLLRFNISSTNSNTNHWEEEYKELGDEFTRADVDFVLKQHGVASSTRNVLWKWKLGGLIEGVKTGRCERGQMQVVKFKKIKK